MEKFRRFALYYAPPPGTFAQAMAAWLGWDPVRGVAVPQPGLPGLDDVADLTRAPRKYGFHGTIRAPFRLAPGVTPDGLRQAVADMARDLAPVRMEGLALHRIEGFLALIPTGEPTALKALAAEVVRRTNPLRAALTEAEIARRRPERLTPQQRAHLDRWGYPHVMEAFQFHLTLTDDLPPDVARAVAAALGDWLPPLLPRPFEITDLCLFGEDAAGQFHLLSRHALTGT